VANAEQSGGFVYDMATYDLREAVTLSAQQVPSEVDEFELAIVTKAPSKLVKAHRVAESRVHFECLYYQTLRLPGNSPMSTVDIVIGKFIGIHIKDEFITSDGKLNVLEIRPIPRLGYYDYAIVESVFEMAIPAPDEKLRSGVEGSR